MRRLTVFNPPSRFDQYEVEYDAGEQPTQGLQLYEDASRTVVSENASPDIGFRFSVNPYRGCSHGCAYCYARPTHEYLGFGSGTDFERKLLIKHRAAQLLRRELRSSRLAGELVVFSGNTDAYQPLEARLKLTRACLEECRSAGNPVHIITKSALVERDVDLLARFAPELSATVAVSVPFWDADVARALEPYAPTPQRRIEVIRHLSSAGIPVRVHVAPVVYGLSDRDVIPILEAARQAGAVSAMMQPVRLPGSTAQVFEERVRAAFPLRAEKVLRAIHMAHGGRLNDPRFGHRFTAQGTHALSLQRVFEATCKRLGYGDLPAMPARSKSSGAGTAPPRPRRADQPGPAQLDLF